MKKNITKTNKKNLTLEEAFSIPVKAAKPKAVKKASNPAKQIPWEERRNEVLAKARAKLRETIAAGKAALENVNAASKAKDDILPEKLVTCMLVRAMLHNDWAFVAPTGYVLVFKDKNVKCIRDNAKVPNGYVKCGEYINIGGEALTKSRFEAARKMFFGK